MSSKDITGLEFSFSLTPDLIIFFVIFREFIFGVEGGRGGGGGGGRGGGGGGGNEGSVEGEIQGGGGSK